MAEKKERPPLITTDKKEEMLVHTYSLEQLLEGAARRSRAHIGQLTRRYGPALAARITRVDKTATADGVLSEVFMRLPDALSTYEHRDKFDAFLWTIAQRVLIDRKRVKVRRSRDVVAGRELLIRGASARRQFENRDLFEKLAKDLAPRARDVWMRHMEGASNDQIAEALGTTPNAIGAMLSRTRKLIRARAQEMELTRSDIVGKGPSSESFPAHDQ